MVQGNRVPVTAQGVLDSVTCCFVVCLNKIAKTSLQELIRIAVWFIITYFALVLQVSNAIEQTKFLLVAVNSWSFFGEQTKCLGIKGTEWPCAPTKVKLTMVKSPCMDFCTPKQLFPYFHSIPKGSCKIQRIQSKAYNALTTDLFLFQIILHLSPHQFFTFR